MLNLPKPFKLTQAIFELLTPKEKVQTASLMALILVMAILDMIGVASILPFIGALSDPSILEKNLYLKKAFEFSGASTQQNFLFILGFCSFVILVVSTSFKAFTIWALSKHIQLRNHSLSCKLTMAYLNQPYEFFINKNSVDLSQKVLTEVNEVIKGALMPMMDLFANLSVATTLIILLLFVNLKLTIFMSFGFIGIYAVIFLLTRNYLVFMGTERADSNRDRSKVLAEAFGGIKEVKIAGLERHFLKLFEAPSKRHAAAQSKAQIVFQMPRFLIEILVFGGMLLIVLFLMQDAETLQNALPLISLFAFSAYRLMPAFRDIFANMSKLRFANHALRSLRKEFACLTLHNESSQSNNLIKFNRSIKLENISYSYPNSKSKALTDLNLEVNVGSMIGFVGSSGSGKTTTADLILGLLQGQSGNLKIDDLIINTKNSHIWRDMVGYVPQHIFLSDDTIAANIAFGLSTDSIDYQAVEHAGRMAKIHDFIIRDLPLAYQTIVGERGIRLSGGQRQRIGIARALYRNPKVLLLDEATSSLDNSTEKEIMDSLKLLSGQLTIIMVAHRLSTLRDCDHLFLFEKGKILASGSYKDIVKKRNLEAS